MNSKDTFVSGVKVHHGGGGWWLVTKSGCCDNSDGLNNGCFSRCLFYLGYGNSSENRISLALQMICS